MNNRLLFATLVSILLLPSAGAASICTPDAVPAATLLLPYFEVGLNPSPSDSRDTVFTVNNAGTVPALASVVLWTDWAVPTGKFHLVLEPGMSRTVSLRDLLVDGSLPEPGDWTDFESCTASDFEISFDQLDRLQNGHSGYPVEAVEGCLGEAVNGSGTCRGGACPADAIGRGYITIDNMNACSRLVPGEVGYFAPSDGPTRGEGVASSVNQLWGDYFYVDVADGRAFGGHDLVHIEAHKALDARHVPVLDPTRGPDPISGGLVSDRQATLGSQARSAGDYTFYGRYVFASPTSAQGGFDHREPLPTVWSARLVKPVSDSTASLIVWRDSTTGVVARDKGFPCGLCSNGAGPDWCPLDEAELACTDNDGEAVPLCESGGVGGGCFPLATNLVPIGALAFASPSANCTLDLNPPASLSRSGAEISRPVAQSWVQIGPGFSSSTAAPAGPRGTSQVLARVSACQQVGPPRQ